jgi:hypothetical protein
LADDAAALVDRVQRLLCASALSAAARTTIVDAVASIGAGSAGGRSSRVHCAILLVLASPDYLVQK